MLIKFMCDSKSQTLRMGYPFQSTGRPISHRLNKYRAMRGNLSEIALGQKSLCTLYVNCFILSFASNRQEMVPACFVVGVVKHWMQTDVHVHDCILG